MTSQPNPLNYPVREYQPGTRTHKLYPQGHPYQRGRAALLPKRSLSAFGRQVATRRDPVSIAVSPLFKIGRMARVARDDYNVRLLEQEVGVPVHAQVLVVPMDTSVDLDRGDPAATFNNRDRVLVTIPGLEHYLVHGTLPSPAEHPICFPRAYRKRKLAIGGHIVLVAPNDAPLFHIAAAVEALMVVDLEGLNICGTNEPPAATRFYRRLQAERASASFNRLLSGALDHPIIKGYTHAVLYPIHWQTPMYDGDGSLRTFSHRLSRRKIEYILAVLQSGGRVFHHSLVTDSIRHGEFPPTAQIFARYELSKAQVLHLLFTPPSRLLRPVISTRVPSAPSRDTSKCPFSPSRHHSPRRTDPSTTSPPRAQRCIEALISLSPPPPQTLDETGPTQLPRTGLGPTLVPSKKNPALPPSAALSELASAAEASSKASQRISAACASLLATSSHYSNVEGRDKWWEMFLATEPYVDVD